jgi:hypothetical protein
MPILENATIAIIEPAKFVDYCLDPHHDDGRHKALSASSRPTAPI